MLHFMTKVVTFPVNFTFFVNCYILRRNRSHAAKDKKQIRTSSWLIKLTQISPHELLQSWLINIVQHVLVYKNDKRDGRGGRKREEGLVEHLRY